MRNQLSTLSQKLQNIVIEESVLSPQQKREIDAFTQHLDILIADERLDKDPTAVAEQLIVTLEEDHPKITAIVNSVIKVLGDMGV